MPEAGAGVLDGSERRIMTAPGRHLENVRTVEQLVEYLREELDWPIADDDPDEIFFDFTAEELGLDPSAVAAITSIRQLRSSGLSQPWGIFFIEFEPRRLPVVALRRILNALATRKRASAGPDSFSPWQVDDLLFISSHGDAGSRHLSFAHFAPNDIGSGLPTLRVLGWDGQDTPLHLRALEAMLKSSLAWPANEADVEQWRTAWRSAFHLRHREVVSTSRALAIRLAELAVSIRSSIRAALVVEDRDGPLTAAYAGFRRALLHDLDEVSFADMYAQTIAYGLLSARVASPTGTTLSSVPVTSPFIKGLMEALLQVGSISTGGHHPAVDFDELGVGDVVRLLDATNIEAVLLDFGDRNPSDDPVIHFYETFLEAYDKRQKVKRGVFYTPQPIVAFMVRSVDEALRNDLGLELGLADTSTWVRWPQDCPV